MRVFIALKISEQLQSVLQGLISELRRTPARVNWVEPAGIHITLKFLGEITSDQLAGVREACATVATRHSPFRLNSTSAGAFPSMRRPRVFWIGLTPSRELDDLHKAIARALETAGFPQEKRAFKAHLTIGRVKDAYRIEQSVELLRSWRLPGVAFPADTLYVMESKLTPGGAVYSVLGSYKLDFKI